MLSLLDTIEFLFEKHAFGSDLKTTMFELGNLRLARNMKGESKVHKRLAIVKFEIALQLIINLLQSCRKSGGTITLRTFCLLSALNCYIKTWYSDFSPGCIVLLRAIAFGSLVNWDAAKMSLAFLLMSVICFACEWISVLLTKHHTFGPCILFLNVNLICIEL